MKTFQNFMEELTHKDILLHNGFVEVSPEEYKHPEGHTASLKHQEIKGKAWAQAMPSHENPKVFKKQIEKLVKPQRTVLPKWKQSAIPDSKGRYH